MRWWPVMILGALVALGCDDGADGPALSGNCGGASSDFGGCGEAPPTDRGVDAAPTGAQGPADGQWRLGMQFVDAGGVVLAFQAEIADSTPGRIGRFDLRVIANDGGLSDPIARLQEVPVDADGRFNLVLDSAVLPADYSPTNEDLTVTLTLAGQTRDAFFCGDITGRVDSLNLPVSMSTFGATPWPANETPTDCDWIPGAVNRVTIGPAERPALVQLPANHDPALAWPVVMVLHGYSTRGEVQAGYFGLPGRVDSAGVVLVIPDGTVDDTDQQYWNALPGCCGGGDPAGPDDVGYLRGLLDTVVADLGGDPTRLYVWGHSNGGFMAHRMICDAGDLIAGAVALAGGTYVDFADCADHGPVALLNAHGTADETIPEAGREGANAFPSATQTATWWAERNGCGASAAGDPLDLMADPAGDETRVTTWADCPDGAAVTLWQHAGGVHIPVLAPAWSDAALEFLLRQRKAD